MSAIRPLVREDLPAVAGLFADFVGWDVEAASAGLVAYYERTLLDGPFADPEIPSLVYEDARDGVVGVIGSHPRRFVHGSEPVRVACSGPLVVHPAHRPRGVGALLLRAYLAGPQDLTFNDRSIDPVRQMWVRLGGVTDTAASIGWAHVLAPAGFAAGALARRALGRERAPGAGLLARVDAVAGRRRLRGAPPSEGTTSEPLSDAALLELLPTLRRAFPLRPAYDEAFLSWLFPELEAADLAGPLVRRLVRDAEGRALGWFVVYAPAHEVALVMQVAAAPGDVEAVFAQLVQTAAEHGSLELRGRVEPHLLPALRERRCRLLRMEWALLHGRRDPALVQAVLAGRALLTRMDGEWWMRPVGPAGR